MWNYYPSANNITWAIIKNKFLIELAWLHNQQNGGQFFSQKLKNICWSYVFDNLEASYSKIIKGGSPVHKL